MADKKILVEIDYDTDSAVKNINTLTDEIVDLEKEQTALKKAFKDGTLTQEQYSQALAENKEVIKKGKSERQNYIKQLKSERGSVEQLTARNKQLKTERDRLSTATKKGRERIKAINQEMDKNNKVIHANKSAVEKQRATWGTLPGPLGKAQAGIKGVGQAFKALLLNPVVAVIAAIVAGFVALTSALKRSEEGQNFLNKAMSVLKSLFETLADVLTTVAENMVKAFKDPQQAVKDLWEVIKTNLVNRVKAVSDLFVNLGSLITSSMKLAGNAIANVFRRNKKDISQFTDDLKDSAAGLGKAYIQALTGIEPDKIIEGFKKLGKEIMNDAQATAMLANAQAKLDKLVRKNIVDEARIRNDVAGIRLKVAEKDKRTDEERLALLDEAIAKEEELLNQNLFIAKERLRIRQIQNGLHKSTKEDLDEEARLRAAVFQAEQTSAEGRRRLAAERSAIAQRLNKEDETNVSEEVKRREEALTKLRELEQENGLKRISDIEERREKEIEIENDEFERRISNELLLNEELQLIKAQHTSRLEEIDEAYKQQRIAKEQEALQATLNSVDQIAEAAGALKDQRIAIQAELLNSTIKFNALETASEKEKYDIFAGFATSLTNFIKTVDQQQFDDLNAQKEAELALVGDNTQAREQIETEYANKAAALKKKQFGEDKAKAIVDTAINTAVAVTKTLANPILSAGIAIAGGIQAGIIAKQEFNPQSYAMGGKMTLFGGKSHDAGGTHLFGSDGSHLEVEKGEAAFVLKKDATAHISALSKINESFGGRSFGTTATHMQEGGQAQLNGFSVQELTNAIQNLQIVTRVESIKTGLSRYDKVINNQVV